MRKISIAALSVLLAIPMAASGQQSPPASGNVLTLEQAINLALRENHLVENAELDVGKARDTLAATRTHRLPSMSLFALGTQQFVEQDITLNNPFVTVVPGLATLIGRLVVVIVSAH